MTDHLRFELPVRAPFRLDFTVSVLRRWPQNALDRWDGRCYRRLMVFENIPHEVSVSQRQLAPKPILDVEISAPALVSAARENTISALQHIFGLQIDLAPFYRLAKKHPRLLALVQPFVGMRPTQFLTLHEALVGAIACQQVSLAVGIQLLNRLAEMYGMTISGHPTPQWAFPQPENLAQLKPTDLRVLGFSTKKAAAIIEISRLTSGGYLQTQALENMDDAAVHDHLCAISGVGPWTADYVLLRGLGRLGTFPMNDSGALNGIKAWLRLKHAPDQKRLHRILTPWNPYAGMIYFHLLLRKLYSQATTI